MRLTFRSRLLLIVGTTAFAFSLVILVSSLIGLREANRLTDLENRLLPKLELGPKLEADFERLRQGLKDAAAAQDMEALGETRALMGRLTRSVAAARTVLDPALADRLLVTLEGYYAVAYDVTRRLVGRETGENIVEALATMQAKQAEAAAAVKEASRLDRRELTEAFAAARHARSSASNYRLGISLTCLALVLLLSIWFSRDILRTFDKISTGFTRFGRGDFTKPIEVQSGDELGSLATEANQMAANLRQLAAQRDHTDWLKSGLASLAHDLRGELEPEEVADRAVRCLAGIIKAPVGALYFDDGRGAFKLLGGYALATQPAKQTTENKAARAAFAPGFPAGVGLIGQAALQTEIVEVDQLPDDYVRINSGIGEGRPRSVVLLPLVHLGKVLGVLEMGLLQPLTPAARELFSAVRETLVIAIEVANGRAAMRTMLAETQRQAQRLSHQEQEMRANNEELQAQQEELRQANEELDLQRTTLEQRNADLEEARRSLQQKASELITVSSYKSRFLANMSHELRTPLNSMLILSELMARNEGQNLTDKQVEYSRTIHGAGKDLLALINQVLDLSKIEAGKQQLQVAPVDLSEVIHHLRRIFEPMATDKGLGFSIDVEDGLPKALHTDRRRLEQVLTNLIGNAIKFTLRGRVALRVAHPAPGVRFRRADLAAESIIALSVSDTGIGIASKDQDLVFTPFERLASDTDHRYGGTGLGLSIARELATLLGGELQLESAPGRGSTFTLFLPTHLTSARTSEEAVVVPPNKGRDAGPPVAGTRPLAAGSPPPIIARSKPATDDRLNAAAGSCLLVIEDDPVFAELLTNIIHGRGFSVLLASSGQEGLALAMHHRPSGIILDVKLPDVDGWTVMDKLRAEPDTKDIPVHFLSAVDAAERGWAMGAVGYLTKPVSHQELVSMVQALAPQAVRNSQRILVLEEDSSRSESLIRLLSSDGLHAHQVKTAEEAFQALREQRFVCLVLDLSLPDLDGLGFLESLKTSTDFERPPVVVYTERALTKEEARRIEEYAEAVILKEGRSAERLLEEIRLFIHHLEDKLARGRKTRPPRVPPSDRSFRGKKMLVVDDDMRTVYALSALLRTKGVEVSMADNGRTAVELLEKNGTVDAVLMDVMMPEMDGYEAMRRIRRNGAFADLPIIALTAKAMKGEREKCLEAGASDYLSKPVDSEELLALLASWLGSQPGSKTEDEAQSGS